VIKLGEVSLHVTGSERRGLVPRARSPRSMCFRREAVGPRTGLPAIPSSPCSLRTVRRTIPAAVEAGVTVGRRALSRIRDRRHGGGSTSSAAYCYAVWMRHLVALSEAGLLARVPTSVAELGPGDSIGVGLAGILSGVRSYVAVDAAVFVRGDPLEPLDELARMIRDRTPIPDVLEMPIGSPPLRSREFPLALIDPEASSPEASPPYESVPIGLCATSRLGR